MSTFARSRSVRGDFGAFDLYAVRALGPEAILNIHSEGEPAFRGLGRDYPAGISDREESDPDESLV